MSDSNNNVFVIIAIVTLVIGGLVGYFVFGSDTEEEIIEVKKTEEANNFLDINGAGASFPFPLVSNMIEKYFETHDTVRINYQSIGSGGGVRQHTAKTIHFGMSDSPLKDSQFDQAPNSLHIPITIGSVVIPYNLPGVDTGMHMTGEFCLLYTSPSPRDRG